VTPLIVQLAEGMLDQSGQLIGSTVNGLVQGSCSVSDRDGLAAFEASFHHAALVVVAAFTGIFVAQVHLHSRDVIAESAEGILYDGTHLSGQRFMTFDIMVGIDLDQRMLLLSYCWFSWSSPVQRNGRTRRTRRGGANSGQALYRTLWPKRRSMKEQLCVPRRAANRAAGRSEGRVGLHTHE
jgi:hypothetical protein